MNTPDWSRWEEMPAPYCGQTIAGYQYRDKRSGRTFQRWQSDGGPSNIVEVDANNERLNAPNPTSRNPRERGVIFTVPYGQSWLAAVEEYIDAA
jgi:hypothetical protein